MQVVEGVISDCGRSGAVTIESQMVPDAWEREPSGHMFRQVRQESTCFFHPYTGGAPYRCSYPRERRVHRLERRH